MNIPTIKRPWERETRYGKRLKRDPFYQSPIWKQTKESFKHGYTEVPSYDDPGKTIKLSNIYCVDCYAQTGHFRLGYAIDHNVAIEDGGNRTDHNNLRNRCESHHNSKSAREGNERRKRQ